ncbi:MAG: hypothetical protein WAW80_01050 [Candidatus Saccharimonadales bacterium]
MNREPLTQEEVIFRGKELVSQLQTELNENERQQINERFGKLAETIAIWAHNNEHNIDNVKRLGGGFKNPVVMVTTAKGEQFVAKAFTDESDLHTTRSAREELDKLFSEDERIIPRSEIFEDSLFSEKAKGESIKNLIADVVDNPENIGRSLEAFEAVGVTLGMLHERTERSHSS